MKEPLYFYHLVNKDADMSQGLLSLQYMYDNHLNELFDDNVSKYEQRILNDWDIKKYQGKKSLTREEYLDGLCEFRGPYGGRYIYFFRFPPNKALGPHMAEILKYKDIYRININDENVLKEIADIFYGYDMSSSDNKLLDRKYYEEITEEEYFKNYDDESPMNFASLNHIGIAFYDDYCPIKYLEKL